MTFIESSKPDNPADLIKILDNISGLDAVDPAEMYKKIYNFPEQLEEAAGIGKKIKPDPNYFKNIKNIVVAGMGGSAIGGDLVRSFLADRISIPFAIGRHYRLPGYVDKNTLVIVSSYSGNTEETLSAFDDAFKRGAMIACITTGGKLGDLADKHGLLKATLPTGYAPRAALGFSFTPLLFLISRLGLVDDVENDIIELIGGLKALRDTFSIDKKTENNPAKALAAKLYNKVPIIYSGPELTDAVGTRWKGQICENAKCLAFNNQFPEFNHNELVGWNVIDAYRDKLVVIYLRDSDDHDRIKKRMSIVHEIIDKLDVEIIDIWSQGDFALGRMFSLIQIGDFASFYLAVLNKIDPTPVKVIDFLKAELER